MYFYGALGSDLDIFCKLLIDYTHIVFIEAGHILILSLIIDCYHFANKYSLNDSSEKSHDAPVLHSNKMF